MIQSLGEILRRQTKLSPMMKGVLAAGVIGIANTFMENTWGEEGKKLAKAVYIKNKNLYIACLSSVMAQEIRMKEADLVKHVNLKCGVGTIQKVRYLS
ncbi:MAG: hypothetical protein ACD_72C00054G0002 [uncultured bacterium]|nr:MAG: hypothetical protein ACD_72C00054G0002 [uncultured bacterium]